MTNSGSQDVQFIWADKVAVALAVTWTILSCAFWAMAFAIIGDKGAGYLWSRVGTKEFNYSFLALASVWLLLRIADFTVTGATYQCAARTATRITAAVRQAGYASVEQLHRLKSFTGALSDKYGRPPIRVRVQ